MYGAFRAPPKYKEQEITKARIITEYYSIIDIDDVIEPFSKERIRLENIGQRIEDFDLLIGITAKEYGLTLVTHNTKHLKRIDGITLEDWA